jgi:hypothetical protein
MVNPQLECEEYPGELRELRAVLAAIAKHGCLNCQLRASIAAACVKQLPAEHPLLTLRCEHHSW